MARLLVLAALLGATGCDLIFTVADRPDGGADAVPPDADDGKSWPYGPSNFDVLDPYIVAGGVDWNVDPNLMIYNTDVAPPAGTPPVEDITLNQVPVRLVRARKFRVPNGTVVLVVGARPLVLAVDDADIAGTFVVQAGRGLLVTASGCKPSQPRVFSVCGGGGAGGSHSGHGGDGGTCAANASPGKGQNAITDDTLVPLFGGCEGGQGDTAATAAGGAGGEGGGAIQISARLDFRMTGSIVAPGIRGGAGTLASGGGGGGAGGSILLESPRITVATLCADGGGGGSGGSPTGPGQEGKDGCNSGQGGASVGNSGAGGNGGDTSRDGANGSAGGTQGGGGGGGASGRVVIRAHEGPADTKLVTPAPKIVQL